MRVCWALLGTAGYDPGMRLIANASCVGWFMLSLAGALRARSRPGRVVWFVSAGIAYTVVAVIGI